MMQKTPEPVRPQVWEKSCPGRRLKILRRPELPSKEEQEAHRALHLPFAAWCPHCVKSRAKDRSHPRQSRSEEGKEEEEERPIVEIDLSYLKMVPEERAVPCIVARHKQPFNGFAMQLTSKSKVNTGVARQLMRFLQESGLHNRVCIRNYPESSVNSYAQQLAKLRAAAGQTERI